MSNFKYLQLQFNSSDLSGILVICVKFHVCGNGPGARLTKAYDVTIQRYHNTHAKI